MESGKWVAFVHVPTTGMPRLIANAKRSSGTHTNSHSPTPNSLKSKGLPPKGGRAHMKSRIHRGPVP